MRRVCCASTRLWSISRGFAKASRIASGVISENVTRRALSGSTPAASATCQAIASPSRSRSVARKTVSADFASLVIAATCFLRSSEITYSGLKSCSTSTPSLFLPGFSGRSRTCPYEASTRYPGPRYRSIVRAFAGDSTITKFFVIYFEPSTARTGALERVRRSDRANAGEQVLFGLFVNCVELRLGLRNGRLLAVALVVVLCRHGTARGGLRHLDEANHVQGEEEGRVTVVDECRAFAIDRAHVRAAQQPVARPGHLLEVDENGQIVREMDYYAADHVRMVAE